MLAVRADRFRHSAKAPGRPGSRSTKPSRWRSSTTTTCWRLEPRFSRAKPKKSRETCVPIPRCLPTGSICLSARLPIKIPASIAGRVHKRLSAQQHEGDIGLSYLIERGKKRQAPPAGAERYHRPDALAGGGQRARSYVSGCLAVRQRAARRIDARTRREGPEELSEDRRHQRASIQGRRHQRERLPEDQAAVAAIRNRLSSRRSWPRSRRSPTCGSCWDTNPCLRTTTLPAPSNTNR